MEYVSDILIASRRVECTTLSTRDDGVNYKTSWDDNDLLLSLRSQSYLLIQVKKGGRRDQSFGVCKTVFQRL